MKNEAIEQAAELFREKIQLAQNSSNRSQDIFKAIREFLADISSNIPNSDSSSVQQDILNKVDELKNRLGK